MSEQNQNNSTEDDKMSTAVGKLLCSILYPIYSIGMFLFYVSDASDDMKLIPDALSTTLQYAGKIICYPSVYISEKF